jgi:WD40 repeat protein
MNRLVRAAVLAAGVVVAMGLAGEARGEKEVFKTKAKRAFLTPDGKKILAAGDNVRMIDVAAKKSALLSKTYHVVTMSSDGSAFATATTRPSAPTETIRVYDAATLKGGPEFEVPGQGFIAFAVAPKGKFVLHGTGDTLYAADAQTGQPRHQFKGLGSQPWAPAVSPDGKLIACGTFENEVFVWEAETFKPVRTFTVGKSVVQSVAFTPDGKRLAASCDDQARAWDLGTGQEVVTIRGTKDKIIRKVAFADDGRLLVTGDSEGLLSVRDASGKPLHASNIGMDAFGLSVSADGKLLLATREDEVAVLYDVSAAVGK